MKTIAIALQKGGTGKTTTTATLAHALALAGMKVLAVDLDPQGNLALALGLEPAPALYDLLVTEVPLRECAVKARANLDLVAGDKTTAEAKEILAGRQFREQCLARALAPVQDEYDVAFLDCAPSLDVLNVAALVAADGLIVPVAVDYLATEGLAQHYRSLAQLQAMGCGCQLLLVVPTFYDRVTRESTEILRQLAGTFRGLVTAPVPRCTRLREAPSYGKTVWEYAPTSSAAEAYKLIVRRLLNGWQR